MAARIIKNLNLIFVIVLTIFASLFSFWRLGEGSLADWDEGIYAQNAYEFLNHSGLVATYNGSPWLEKPPVGIWLNALGFKIFGVNNFGLRAVGGIFFIASVIFLYFLVKKSYSAATGFFIALFYTCSPFILLHHITRTGDFEEYFLFFIIFLLWLYNNFSKSKLMFGLVGFTGGLAFLTRGYIAVLPLLIISIHWIWVGHMDRIKKTGIMWLVFLATILPWHIYAAFKYPMLFWSNYIGLQFWQRISIPIETHVGGPLFYFKNLFLAASWPLTIFFIISSIYLLYFVLKNGGDREKLWLVWGAVFILSLTVTKTKLYWYAAGLVPMLYVGAVPMLRSIYHSLIKLKITNYRLWFFGIMTVVLIFYGDRGWQRINAPLVLPVDEIENFITANNLTRAPIYIYQDDGLIAPAINFQLHTIAGHDIISIEDLSQLPRVGSFVVVTQYNSIAALRTARVGFLASTHLIMTKYKLNKKDIYFIANLKY